MKPSTRIIINSGAQYLKTIINVVLGFYCTRVVLQALGESDFGIYSLIASVTALLAFVCNALSITTQRYLSYHQAHSDLAYLQKLFSNSFVLMLFIGILCVVILELLGIFLFDGFLNIVPNKIGDAKIVFQCSIIMVLLSFITAPFRALVVSHENLVFASTIDVLDGVLKVIIAILLTYCDSDRLIYYAIGMAIVWAINLILFALYSVKKYPESKVFYFRLIEKKIIKGMTGFTGWTLYSTGCTVARVQGFAIVLNKFYGAVANAAFGIALQINSASQFVSSSLLNAINPQIIKAEGASNRAKMLELSVIAGKMSFFLLSIVVVPMCIYTPLVLKFWLNTYPTETILLCRVMLISALVDSMTCGLGTANQALGKIRNFSLIVYTTKLLSLPAFLALIILGQPLSYAIWTYAIFEGLSAILRIPILQKTANLRASKYMFEVIRYFLPPFLILICFYAISYSSCTSLGTFILYCVLFTVLYAVSIYLLGVNKREKSTLNNIISSMKRRHG